MRESRDAPMLFDFSEEPSYLESETPAEALVEFVHCNIFEHEKQS